MQFEPFFKTSKGERACFLNLDVVEGCINNKSEDPMKKQRKMKVQSEVLKVKDLCYEKSRQFHSAAKSASFALLHGLDFRIGGKRKVLWK